MEFDRTGTEYRGVGMALVSEFKSFLNEGPFDFIPVLNGAVYALSFFVFGSRKVRNLTF